MTLQELKERVRVQRDCGYCSYKVTITYHSKEYSCHSNNSLAWDRLDDYNYRDNEVNGNYTNKGAYEAFYNECKQKNHLGEYNY
ncbi:MAG: hypothetical protein J6X18_01050 [Bacteroidales bacterium]|nr:hypothetical protein [Bacteroidales bacterium]